LGQADLHMHSKYSDGRASVEAILNYVEYNTALDIVAITDHDCLDGAWTAQEFVAQRTMRIQLIPGAEISTRDGHLLALNIERLIPAHLSMKDSIQAVHEQGGVAVVAHPLSPWCPSATLETLLSLAPHLPDGLEVRNASFAGVGSNKHIQAVNRLTLNWSELGGSDAHSLHAIASSYTLFPGATTTELLTAIRAGETIAAGQFWPKHVYAGQLYHELRERLPKATPQRKRILEEAV
jgi:predicted metal-dependent phosphoesterase TrpH